MLRRFTTRGGKQRDRKGASVVEFAVIAPVLFLMFFGMIEYGRMAMVQQTLTNASREGARKAILNNSTSSEVTTTVDSYLASASISGATVTLTPTDVTTAASGETVTVNVSVPFDNVSWLPAPWFLEGITLSAESIMIAERP